MLHPDELDPVTAAYHEAGHILMAHLLGGHVQHATIEDEDSELMGMTTVRWQSLTAAARRRNSALVALAGPVAEVRWRGDADLLEALTAWQADWQEVQKALAAEVGDNDPAPLLHQWLGEVHSQCNDPLIWERICRVADALEAHGSLDEALLDEVLTRG